MRNFSSKIGCNLADKWPVYNNLAQNSVLYLGTLLPRLSEADALVKLERMKILFDFVFNFCYPVQTSPAAKQRTTFGMADAVSKIAHGVQGQIDFENKLN